jgi:hypothetical protein
MQLIKTLKRFIRILFIPLKEWHGIADDSEPLGKIIKYYAWPFIVVSAVVETISLYVRFAENSTLAQFKIPFILTILFFNMVAPIFVILSGGLMIGRISKAMGADANRHSSFRLLIYSYTPLFISTILINAGSNIQYLGLISLYAIVIFWLGMDPILHLPSDRKPGFLIVSIMVLCFLFFVITMFIRLAINLLYPEGVVLFL